MSESEVEFVIEEVRDIQAAWPEVEPLLLGIVEYHRPWDKRPLAEDWEHVMREFMAVGDTSVTFLGRVNGQAAAFLNGVLRPGGIFTDDYGYVNNAFVAEEARAGGIGSALLRRFEAWCMERGAQEVRLSVNAGNQPGLRFWQRAGFEVDSFEMRKTFPEVS